MSRALWGSLLSRQERGYRKSRESKPEDFSERASGMRKNAPRIADKTEDKRRQGMRGKPPYTVKALRPERSQEREAK